MEDSYKLTKDGQTALDRYQLGTAETKFLSALEHMQDDTKLKERCCIKCLRGLAEINNKRARFRRNHIEEWHTLCLRVIAYYKQAVDYCNTAIKTTQDEITKEWLQGILPRCQQELRQHQAAFQVSLKSRLIQETNISLGKKLPLKVNTAWLVYMENHIKQMLQTYSDGSGESGESGESSSGNSSEAGEAAQMNASLESISSSDSSKRIDFDKVRNSIMTLVKGITTDMRRKHARKHLSESTLKRTVSLEVITNMTPSASSTDILGLFEEAIIEHRQNEPFPFSVFGGSSVDLSTTPTEKSNKRKATSEGEAPNSSDEDDDTLKDKTSESEGDDTFEVPDKVKGKHSGTTTRRHTCTEFPTFNRNPKRPKTLKLRKRHTDTDIQFAPARKNCVLYTNLRYNVTDNHNYQNFKQYQVTEYMLEVTLAQSIVNIADGLLREGEKDNAIQLYDHALDFFKATSNMENKTVAHILLRLGEIKGAKGNISECSIMLENAIAIYDNLKDDDQKEFYKAMALLKLGEMYMVDKDHNENVVFDYVIEIVKREINREVQTAADGDAHNVKETPELESGDSANSYPVNVQEALNCLTQALSILSELRLARSELHTSEYISVLTRLGDCHIVTGDSNKAVLCYEEALCLLKNTIGSGSLENNAHLLVMLGVANFILRNYSKAVAVFTTATVLQQHLYPGENSFECAFTYTMIGFCHFMNKLHYRCIACCLRAFDMYNAMYKDKVHTLNLINRWFITQTLYTIGYAFFTIKYHQKALFYLLLCKEMLIRTEEQDCQQLVHVMKVMGDVYLDDDEKEMALECFSESMTLSNTLGDQAAPTALKNQLLNCMADIQVSTKQYAAAAEYLEQALDCQRNVETSIKGDLAGILLQLGQTSLYSGDLEKALECYLECLDAYHEIKGTPGPEIASVLVKIASLYHVKACLEDDEEKHKEYIFLADRHFKDAVAVDKKSCIIVFYANFLYHNGEYMDALEVLLEYIFDNRKRIHQLDLHYSGVEQSILPDHFDHEAHESEEIAFDSYVFAAFIAILCFKGLELTRDADDTLVFMGQEVMKTELPINYSILGYALMELDMYEAAAESFEKAFMINPDYDIARTNHETCLELCKYEENFKTLLQIVDSETNPFYEHLEPFKAKLRGQKEGVVDDVDMPGDDVDMPEVMPTGMRDSGYYDNAELELQQQNKEIHHEEMPEVAELSLIQETYETKDVGYTSTEDLKLEPPKESIIQTTWTSYETDLKRDNIEIVGRDENASRDIDIETETTTEWTRYDNGSPERENETQHEFETIQEYRHVEKEESDSTSSNITPTEETWEIMEETVETPPEILAILKRQQQQSSSAFEQQQQQQMSSDVHHQNISQSSYTEYTPCVVSTNVIESSPSSGSTRNGSEDRDSPYSTLSTNTVIHYQDNDSSLADNDTSYTTSRYGSNYTTTDEYSSRASDFSEQNGNIGSSVTSMGNPLDRIISDLQETDSEPVKHPSMYHSQSSNYNSEANESRTRHREDRKTAISNSNPLDRIIDDLRSAEKDDIDDTIADLQAIATGSYTTGNINKLNDYVVETKESENDNETEQWIVEETSVDTPQEILDILRKQNSSNNGLVESNTAIERSSTESRFDRNRTTGTRYVEQNFSRNRSGEVSMEVSPAEDEYEEQWVTEEEVVQETPPEILAMLRKSSNITSRPSFSVLDNHESSFNEYDHLKSNGNTFGSTSSLYSNRLSPNNNRIFNTRSYENIASIPTEEVGQIKEVKTEHTSPEVYKLVVGEHAELSQELVAGLESLGIISQLDFSEKEKEKQNTPTGDQNLDLDDRSRYSSSSSLNNLISPSEMPYKQDSLLRSTIDKCLSMKEKYSIKVETPYLKAESPQEEQQEEETWQTWEEEETVETPPELLRAILAAQQGR